MSRLVPAFVAGLSLLAASAIAQEHKHPGIVGVWTGEIDAVSVAVGEGAKPVFGTFTARLEITEQQGERFAGTFQLEDESPKHLVGVFTEPGHILWAEPDGFAHGRVIDNEQIEVCYVRSTDVDQVASCERYQRQH
jgi:hypothetical protein